MRLDIKPMSVNEAWKGKIYKSIKYKRYVNDICSILRPCNIPGGHLEIYLKFGFSSKASDFDNPVKPFVDCLQKKYGFNDKMIKRCVIEVDHVKKGSEFIEWNIKEYAIEQVS